MSVNKLRDNESGLVSIIVSIVLVTLIALIATSFALLSRRETRQALDRQLSTQAFYAAESGVNDAVQKVNGDTQDYKTCDQAGNLNQNLGNQINDDFNLSYTCVLIEENPTSLAANVSTDDATILRVQTDAPIGRLRVSWQDGRPGPSQSFASNLVYNLPQSTFTNSSSFHYYTGILRMNIIPVKDTISRTDLIENTQTLFLYPYGQNTSPGQVGEYTAKMAGESAAVKTAEQGQFVNSRCNTGNSSGNFPKYCNVDILGLENAGTNTFYIRLNSMYQPSDVVVRAFPPGGSTTQMSLYNGQAVIDATGKANDVLRRIQVRIPVRGSYAVPNFGLESADDICKLITTYSNQANVSDGCTSRYVN